MTRLKRTRRIIGGLGAGALLGLALTFGVSSIANPTALWRKVGQTIEPVPSSVAVNLESARIGDSGTQLTGLFKGTCDLLGMDASHVATTTKAYDCAIAGVVAGDTVLVGQATTTPTTNLGWRVMGANASSTSGYITVHIANFTGGDVAPSISAVGSSTPYAVVR